MTLKSLKSRNPTRFGRKTPPSISIDNSYLGDFRKFTDQELDTETGLYNYDARLYDPVIGRFITADSIIPDLYNPQSLNRYSYVLNNPLIYIDPTGHFTSPSDSLEVRNDNAGNGEYGTPRKGMPDGMHSGIDMAAEVGQQAIAPVSGTVEYTVNENGEQIVNVYDMQGDNENVMVRIVHAEYNENLEGTLVYNVNEGDILHGVTATDQGVDSYGNSITPHFHVEIYLDLGNGQRVDPTSYIFNSEN